MGPWHDGQWAGAWRERDNATAMELIKPQQSFTWPSPAIMESIITLDPVQQAIWSYIGPSTRNALLRTSRDVRTALEPYITRLMVRGIPAMENLLQRNAKLGTDIWENLKVVKLGLAGAPAVTQDSLLELATRAPSLETISFMLPAVDNIIRVLDWGCMLGLTSAKNLRNLEVIMPRSADFLWSWEAFMTSGDASTPYQLQCLSKIGIAQCYGEFLSLGMLTQLTSLHWACPGAYLNSSLRALVNLQKMPQNQRIQI